MANKFKLTACKKSEENKLGAITISALVSFYVPPIMTGRDYPMDFIYSMDFVRYKTQDDGFVLSAIHNIFWNDTFMIAPQSLNFIQAHYDELIDTVTKCESVLFG